MNVEVRSDDLISKGWRVTAALFKGAGMYGKNADHSLKRGEEV
ncbi:hypothetical protein [Desulfosediminicola flagellatus]|nr:hypothetical protein [Desulfosediminicola flagellatus]